MTHPVLDMAGIGAGPFNLSVAALLDTQPQWHTRFFERKARFAWHPGLMLDHAFLQTSWMKDLVSPVDPTNPHSFLNYLVNHGRFYAFINAAFESIYREEFADYLRWVAGNLSSLALDHHVQEVNWDGDLFQVHTQHGTYAARNLCVGGGVRPHVPRFARHWLGKHAFHGYEVAHQERDFSHKRVAVIGGGQTGAEVVLHLLENARDMRSLHWFSRRPNLEPLDESAFTNEYFTPDYVKAFFHLEEQRKAAIVAYQKLASDGISPCTLQAVYQNLYRSTLQPENALTPVIAPDRELIGGEIDSSEVRLELKNHFGDKVEHVAVDVVVFCTGFSTPVPDCLEPLSHRLQWSGHGAPKLDKHYRMMWNGPEDRQIFAVNAGKMSHGIVDPQTSLMAWRAATIINAFAGREVYALQDGPGFVQWGSTAASQMGAVSHAGQPAMV